MKLLKALSGALLGPLLLASCSDSSDHRYYFDPETEQEKTLRINQVQVLGTHNSYHIQPQESILTVLAQFMGQELADSLEYTALPLAEQFELGVRQIELDIFADPEGGMYAFRKGAAFVGDDPQANEPELYEPGFKVLHIQEIDFETHCFSFKSCLTILKEWSDANPAHLPITVMVEAKEEAIPDPVNLGFVIPIVFGPDEVDSIDTEILDIFPRSQLIVPDDVRGEQDTLEEAVLNGGWPTLAEARGRVMFAFLNRSAARGHYIDGHPSLQGRIMFTNSTIGEAEAAWFNVNNALDDFQEIRNLVAAGYIVRTRADEETRQAREGDYTLQEAAFDSGGQMVSTDYVVPNEDFGTGYFAEVPGGHVGRCNPVSAGDDCDSGLIAP